MSAAEVETNIPNHLPVMSTAEELPCQIDVAASATITTTDSQQQQQHVAVMSEGVLITEPVLGLRMLMSSRVSLSRVCVYKLLCARVFSYSGRLSFEIKFVITQAHNLLIQFIPKSVPITCSCVEMGHGWCFRSH